MRYRMILFDFFNTLVVSNSSRIPKLEVDGREVTTTAPLLHRRLVRERPELEVDAVYRALASASRKARKKRGPELREPPALERFQDVAAELGLAAANGALPRELLACHMEAVTGCFALPAAHRRLLETLRAGHRLGIFSNFDHAPGLLGLLRDHGVEGWFDPVVISETIGYRKPGAPAFREALALAGEEPRHILFVGDSLEHDVQGALQAGMDVAWINLEGEPETPSWQPTYTLAGLPELGPLLERLAAAE